MYPLGQFMPANLVLTFHTVTSKDWIRNTLKTIKRIYRFISVSDIEAYYYNNEEYNNCCHICFDDGDISFYKNAYPVLKKMNIPATLFVSPKVVSDGTNYWFQELSYIIGHLDIRLVKEAICEILNCNYRRIEKCMVSSMFNCMRLSDILRVIDTLKQRYHICINKSYNIKKEQLCELKDSGIIAIGAHTINHPILSNESDDIAAKEIRASIEQLSAILGRDIKYFAYPNGIAGLDYGEREETILKENKIRLAFGTNNGFFSGKTTPLNIPRSGFIGKEKSAWILSKLFFMPIWGKIKREIEVERRKRIKALIYS